MHIRVEPVMRADASIGPYNGTKVTYTVLGAYGQYRIILSADTASEVRQMPSQKRR